MVRAMIGLGLLIGCGGGSQLAADARVDPLVCKAQLEARIDRACAVPSDCVLVDSADCCGTVELAIRAGTEGAFPEAEGGYVACLACPPLGCQHADQAEDGATPGAGQAIVATCDLGRCRSVIR